MTRMFSRRTALKATGAAFAGAIVGKPAILLGQAAMPRVTYVTLATGFNVILNEYMSAKRFDLKHGVNIDVINSYVSVTNYYNDFTAGTFELGIGAWDTWASRFLAGVPLKLIATITDYDMLFIVAMNDGPKSVADLRGKTLAATLSSGAYRVTRYTLSAFHNMQAEKDYRVQNTESPAGAVAMVLGGSTQGGLTWEPNVSVGIEREPKLTTIYNVGQDFEKNTGIALPYFSVALRNEAEKRHPGVSAKIAAAFSDCIKGVMDNPDEAAKLSAAKMKVSEAALMNAFSTKRLLFKPMSMSDPKGREALLKAADYLAKNGMLEKPVGPDFLA